MKYIKCEVCGCLMRLEVDEKHLLDEQKCIYCGRYLADFREEVTEREWRRYGTGVVGQPFEWNKTRKTKETQLW